MVYDPSLQILVDHINDLEASVKSLTEKLLRVGSRPPADYLMRTGRSPHLKVVK
jgi:hypothetical protein